MQTPTASTKRESDSYYLQQNPTSDHLENMQNKTFFPYFIDIQLMKKNVSGIVEFI